jgi:hypothetical protein
MVGISGSLFHQIIMKILMNQVLSVELRKRFLEIVANIPFSDLIQEIFKFLLIKLFRLNDLVRDRFED